MPTPGKGNDGTTTRATKAAGDAPAKGTARSGTRLKGMRAKGK